MFQFCWRVGSRKLGRCSDFGLEIIGTPRNAMIILTCIDFLVPEWSNLGMEGWMDQLKSVQNIGPLCVLPIHTCKNLEPMIFSGVHVDPAAVWNS